MQEFPNSIPQNTLEIFSDRTFPEWLAQEQISIAYSTYQTDRLTLLGINKETGRFSGFERSFGRAMGLYVQGDRMYLGTKYQIWQFENGLEPGQMHNGYDKLYIPRVGYTTGDLDVHDIVVDANGQIVFVCTMLNCIATLSSSHSCKPLWKPPFISRLINEDRCHLNGLALVDGSPRYVTVCSQSDIVDGWRDRRVAGGCVVDILSNEVVVRGLSMPHSPRFYQGKLWLLNSGTGELGMVDLQAGKFEPLTFCPGFLRGLAFWKNWAIVGLSKPRHGDRSFSGLPLDETLKQKDADPRCGLMVIDLNTGAIAHWYQIDGFVTELYDVQVLPGVQRPMLLGFQTEEIAQLISIDTSHDPELKLAPATPSPSSAAIQTEAPSLEAPNLEIYHPLQVDPVWLAQIAQLRQQRYQLGQTWLQMPTAQLAAAYAGELGQLQQALLNSDLKCIPLEAEERRILDHAIAQLQSDPRSLSSLLVIMLYAFPHHLPLGWYRPIAVPAWLSNDYLIFMLKNPNLFKAIGEAEIYYQFMQDWVDFLHRKILANPDADSWQKVAILFTQAHCFIPFYFCDRNLKDISTQRAEIMEVALKAQGCQLDWAFAARSPGAKIRLGILRSKFTPCPETYASLSTFEFLDRDQFEITLYAFQESEHPLEIYCKSRCDRFVLLPLETIEAVDSIRHDNLDIILISQNLTAAFNPITALALHRLARIDLATDVSPLTTGMSRIDYFLSGELSQINPKPQEHYTEKLILHDGGANCFSFHGSFEESLQQAATIKINRKVWGVDESAIAFISGANYFKIIPELQEAWAQIIASVPNSILVLYPFNPNWTNQYPESLLIQAMQEVFQRYGISSDRLVVLSSKISRADIQACLKLADIYLDSFPYSGSTSFIDPLKAGLPVVVKSGESSRSCMSSSLLQLLSLPQLITTTETEYINLAIRLAHDLPLRQSYREQILERMAQPPKFLDSQHHATQVGKILKEICADEIEISGDRNLAQTYLDRSHLLKQEGKLAEAETCLREAVRLHPQLWGAWNNLGTLLQNQNRLEEALPCYENAIAHNPNFAEAIANRASLWQLDGELEPAKTAYLQAIQLKPEYVPAHFNLATIYKQQGRLASAVQHFQEVINRQPDYQEAHFALAQILEYQDQYDQAEHHYLLAQQFSPAPLQISLVLAYLRRRFCNWQDYDAHTQELIALLDDPMRRQQCILSPFALSTFPVPIQLHRLMAEDRGQSLRLQAAKLQDKQPILKFNHQRSPSNSAKLRIAYLSPDFREHAVGRLICQLFQHHDRDRFEIFAYSSVDINDQITEQVRAGCDRYIELSSLSVAEAAQRIHGDGIDILIDLAGYTIGNLSEVLALQPAPIQVSWLGYPDTLGAKFIQYILADEWLIPSDRTPYFTEEVIYLPHAFISSPLPIRSAPFTRAELGLPEKGFIYCCFNSHYKINPPVFDVWMRILQQVPKSVLWLTDGDQRAKQNLRQAALDRGIDPNRLIFATKKSHADYLAQFQLANLFLDTFTYNAGSTAAAAIGAGLPLLTKPGDAYAARMGASICASSGLESLICQSVEEYEQRAIAFGNKPSLLKPIRSKLQKDKESLPLFNLSQFVQNLESVYTRLWNK
jgi:uncharacterized protein (TIGR03032 family)